jgi:hypothetical protein
MNTHVYHYDKSQTYHSEKSNPLLSLPHYLPNPWYIAEIANCNQTTRDGINPFSTACCAEPDQGLRDQHIHQTSIQMWPQIIPLFRILVAQNSPRLRSPPRTGSPRGRAEIPLPTREKLPRLCARDALRQPKTVPSTPRCLPPTSAPQCRTVSYPAPRSTPSGVVPLRRRANHSTVRIGLRCRGGPVDVLPRANRSRRRARTPYHHTTAARRKIRRRNRLKSLGETLAR